MKYSTPEHLQEFPYVAEKRQRTIVEKYGFHATPGNHQDEFKVHGNPTQDLMKIFGVRATIKPTAVSGSYSDTFVVGANINRAHGVLRDVAGEEARDKWALVKFCSPRDGAHEARIIRRLNTAAPFRKKCLPRELVPAAIAPTLYCAGTFGDNYVIVMEFIRNSRTLAKVPMTQHIAENFEAAVLAMWSAGIVHADLHFNNVMVNREGDVRIIDFGFATRMPEGLHRKIMQKICEPDDALEDPDVRDYIKMYQMHRGRGVMFANDVALRRAFDALQNSNN